VISNKQTDLISHALNAFHIELPSWGFANTGTRFGKFLQPAAATSTAEKFADAGLVRSKEKCRRSNGGCRTYGSTAHVNVHTPTVRDPETLVSR